MKYYGVKDARMHIKEVLDSVSKDEVVFIKRKGIFYKISMPINQEQCLEDYYNSNGYKKEEVWVKPKTAPLNLETSNVVS